MLTSVSGTTMSSCWTTRNVNGIGKRSPRGHPEDDLIGQIGPLVLGAFTLNETVVSLLRHRPGTVGGQKPGRRLLETPGRHVRIGGEEEVTTGSLSDVPARSIVMAPAATPEGGSSPHRRGWRRLRPCRGGLCDPEPRDRNAGVNHGADDVVDRLVGEGKRTGPPGPGDRGASPWRCRTSPCSRHPRPTSGSRSRGEQGRLIRQVGEGRDVVGLVRGRKRPPCPACRRGI